MRWPVALILLPLLATTAAANPPVRGGGPVPAPPVEANCVPADQAERLRALLPAAAPAYAARMPQLTLFADPMGGGGMNSFGKTVTNYVDRAPAANSILDWNCGSVTYDGHTGTDIEIRDFFDMDEGVPVLAAAAGTVAHTHDGEFDRRTEWVDGVVANDVIVQHADGTYAYYWHLRKGSVRVAVGQPVATGDTLGLIGSSGFSSGPHLHFEMYEGAVRDPFTGPCQALPTRWQAQQPWVLTYPVELFNSGITTLPLTWGQVCERPPVKTHVQAGSNLYHWFRLRNVHPTDVLEARLYGPFGLWTSYAFNPSGPWSSSWWYLYWTMPTDPAAFGDWHSDLYVNGVFKASYHYALDAQPNTLPTVASRLEGMAVDATRDVDLAGADADGSVFRHEILSGPFHGTATLTRARGRVLRYVPAVGYTGSDSVVVRAVDDENAVGPSAVIRFRVGDLAGSGAPVARALALARIAPDPVRGDSRVSFTLPAGGRAELDVLDTSGRRMNTWNAQLPPGTHDLSWSELTGGGVLPPGLYFVRLRSNGAVVSRRVTALR